MQPRIGQFTVSISVGEDTLNLIRQILTDIRRKGPFGRPIGIAAAAKPKEIGAPMLLTPG